MNSKAKSSVIFLFMASILWIICLITPIIEQTCDTNRSKEIGFDLLLPIFNGIPIMLLWPLLFLKNSNTKRWLALLIGTPALFPTSFVFTFLIQLEIFCTVKLDIGYYFYLLSCLLLFITGVQLFNDRNIEKKASSNNDLIDDIN